MLSSQEWVPIIFIFGPSYDALVFCSWTDSVLLAQDLALLLSDCFPEVQDQTLPSVSWRILGKKNTHTDNLNLCYKID